MNAIRRISRGVAGAALLLFASNAWAQVTINEYVDDERTASAGQVNPDTREFVELYNTGVSAVDISGWTITTKQLGSNFNLPAGTKTYTIPASQSIPAGGFYVIGAAAVPNVNFTLTGGGFGTGGTDFFPDGAAGNNNNGQHVLELRNTSNVLVDALGDDIFRGSERANLTAEQLDQVGGIRGGWWGQDPSFNLASLNNVQFSLARFLNGVDSNNNGRDFGMLPVTPGTSNNLPQVATHTIPNVDSAGLEEEVNAYYASFVMGRAIDPTNGDGNVINPSSTGTASPQGGKAIIAYDETGGGNAIYSKQLVHKFDLYAYVQAGPLGTTSATDTQDSEATIYGIGTTDGLFGTPDPLNSLTVTPNITSSQNGSTGVGWMIERVENFNAGSPTAATKLLLIDFGDGGDGVPEDREWEVMKSYDITTSGWVRLSVEHNAATGVITAKKDSDTIVYSVPNDFNNNNVVDAGDYVLWRKGGTLPNETETPGTPTADDYASWKAHFGETTKTGELGTFYVGYRENLLDSSGNFLGSRPPTFDMIGGPGLGSGEVPEPTAMALAAVGLLFGAISRRRA
jgi:hypothetical protein